MGKVKRMSLLPMRIAIIGCGAVTEQFHLPASVNLPECQVVALVDRNLERARTLARQYGVPNAVADWSEIQNEVDLALIATPPNSHAAIGVPLLQRGVHILCEKPLSLTIDEGQQMLQAAAEGRATLAVGLVRRFYPSFQALKRIVEQGQLGPIRDITVEEGGDFSWPTQTGYMFRREGGGGVLFDSGSHSVDLILWLMGDVRGVTYYDDALGGVESNARLELQFADGATGLFCLSRTRGYTNTLRVTGACGWAQVGVGEINKITVCLPGGLGRRSEPVTLAGSAHIKTMQDAFVDQLRDAIDSARHGRPPCVSGLDGVRALELIRRCYSQKGARPMPERLPLPGGVW
jgi:predicted dehydrogenase